MNRDFIVEFEEEHRKMDKLAGHIMNATPNRAAPMRPSRARYWLLLGFGLGMIVDGMLRTVWG